MKNIIQIISGLLLCSSLWGQQLPLTESYFVDKYALSSAYAGNSDNKSLFASYRRDWSGVSTGPRTFRLSYHDGFQSKAGIGGKMVFDKTGIFQQFFGMATYTYRTEFVQDHFLFFGLSAGLYRNTLNFSNYYNDPNFTTDPTMINKDVKSKMKFVSDFSMVYSFKGIETGIMFTNINFGEASYSDVSVKYRPLSNYQIHASYTYALQQNWAFSPIVILRGGKDIGSQLEIAAQASYRKIVWASLIHRGKGVLGFGIGANPLKGIVFNYNYNLSSNITVNAFQNHEITLGLKLGEFLMKKEPVQVN
ncbi:MAG: PorP/SprF family type IX secretion system membrane protein [Bacteroidales bacterium]|nr:PorP/SprF family type IX secretion system membrane protein [Bacteroidales bacterium]